MLNEVTDKDLKTYWKIGEVAEMIGQATSLVRFWGEQLPWTKPIYGKTGNRQYTREDAMEVLKVNYLIHHKGMSLMGVKLAHKEGYMEGLIEFFESLPVDPNAPLLSQNSGDLVIHQKGNDKRAMI